ncbi:hypothetical protein JTB14_012883 [Gonioctena quinquepunctata]|nr:hypothetical protein JTB14_012883 [Gonioctena quinquepunctata]
MGSAKVDLHFLSCSRVQSWERNTKNRSSTESGACHSLNKSRTFVLSSETTSHERHKGDRNGKRRKENLILFPVIKVGGSPRKRATEKIAT